MLLKNGERVEEEPFETPKSINVDLTPEKPGIEPLVEVEELCGGNSRSLKSVSILSNGDICTNGVCELFVTLLSTKDEPDDSGSVVELNGIPDSKLIANRSEPYATWIAWRYNDRNVHNKGNY